MAWYKHTAIVKGHDHGMFPMDMLRYDRCFPEETSDAGRIRDALDRQLEAGTPIMVSCYRDSKAEPWTVERWASFGWSCRHHESRKVQ